LQCPNPHIEPRNNHHIGFIADHCLYSQQMLYFIREALIKSGRCRLAVNNFVAKAGIVRNSELLRRFTTPKTELLVTRRESMICSALP
jgi:hypothetical protein